MDSLYEPPANVFAAAEGVARGDFATELMGGRGRLLSQAAEHAEAIAVRD
jgi:hypothetical protein